MADNRTRRGNWPGVKLSGDETFFVDLRNSLTPIISAGDGGVTIDRNDTVSHVFDYQGNLVNVTANESRIMGARHLSPDWSRKHAGGQSINPDTCHGAIVEQASTNRVQYFDDIDNAWWTQNNLNATSGSGTNIAGRAARGIIGNATTNLHGVAKGLPTDANGIHHMSCLVAAGDQDFIFFRNLDLTSFDTATVWFDLANGVTGTEAATGASQVIDASIRKVNGGYWCTATIQVVNTLSSFVFSSTSADNTVTFLGDNSTVNTWVSALQIELNVADTTFPSMPLLGTEGSDSASADELIEFDSANYSEAGYIAGEFYLPYGALDSDPASVFTFQDHGQDTENSMRCHLFSNGTLQFVMWPDEGAAFGTMLESAVLPQGTWVRFAAGWDSANNGTSDAAQFFVNGVEGTVFSGLNGYIVPLASAVNRFYLGSRNSTGVPRDTLPNHQDQFFHLPTGWLKKGNTKLSAAELKALSL